VVHVIAYDLHEPNDTAEDYERLITAVKKRFSSWCHLEKSVWLVSTSMDAGEVRDFMKTCVNNSDTVFVARLSGNWGSWNLSQTQVDWLKAQTF
jgi:hypothetical protein